MPVTLEKLPNGKWKCPHCDKGGFKNEWAVKLHCAHVHKGMEQPEVGWKKSTNPSIRKTVSADKQREPVLRKIKKIKIKQVVVPQTVPVGPLLNFCPCCGLNLNVVNKAMEIAAKVKEHTDGQA